MEFRNILFVSLIILSAVSLFSCTNKQSGRRIVSVSILPQKYLVERIAGDYVSVNVMIPPGMSPATCDLNIEQLKKLHQSGIYFSIGYLPFETIHLYPVLEQEKNIRLINHSNGIELVPGTCGRMHTEECDHHDKTSHHHEGEEIGVDPHIWLSPRYVRMMADTILQVLSEQYPEQKEVFEANHEKLCADIADITAKASEAIGDKERKIFAIYHPALTYFAKDFGMEQVSIEEEGKEPSPTHLKEVIDIIRKKGINIIFIQNQFDQNNAKSVATETGGKIIPIDPLNENWLEEMNHLIQIFTQYL